MVLEELRLTLFKGFRDFTLTCEPFTCLVGLNSNGKTSILQAIRLLHDLMTFTFHSTDQPNFVSPRWQSNPSQGINRMSPADPDAIWLHKATTEPCRITARYSGSIEVELQIPGRDRYEMEIHVGGKSIKAAMSDAANQDTVRSLLSQLPAYLPPVGALSPSEALLRHSDLEQRLDAGRDWECWRSRLHWLYNDGDKAAFDQVVKFVQQYLPDASLLPPRLSHDPSMNVLVEFQEKGTKFDISTSGGGLRTVLNLATLLHFSPARCFLCDEPDSHLHGSLQRSVARMLQDFSVENDRQVLVATHAPDFIAEVPVKSIIWIDRALGEGQRCNDVGEALVDLGSVAKADAVRARGADKVLFVEGSFDRSTLHELFSLAGGRNPFEDESVLVGCLPSGKGDARHLGVFRGLLRNTFRLDVTVACIIDTDYELSSPDEAVKPSEHDTLVVSLGRKECENYFLEPDVLARAAQLAAERKKARTGQPIAPPGTDACNEKLQKILMEQAIRDSVRLQLVPRYRDTLDRTHDASTRERDAEKWFEEHWSDERWRIRNCPGKMVLKRLRRWCQEEYRLTLTLNVLVEALNQCPREFAQVAQRLQGHLYPEMVGA